MLNTVLLDLDGTLTDPAEGITRCIQHALAQLDVAVPAQRDLLWCIGPPLLESLRTLLGDVESTRAREALELYRERFRAGGMFENQVYPGIEAALADMVTAGRQLFVCTSKPTVFARQIVDHFGLAAQFRGVYGSELDGTRTDKTSLIAYLLARESLQPDHCVMVGDRCHDIVGARNNDVRALGVRWGYGSEEELRQAGAAAVVDHVSDLARAVVE